MKLVQRPDLQRHHTKVIFSVHALIFLWSQSLKDGLKHLQDNYYKGLELGDTEYAALSAAFFCTHSFGAGEGLDELKEKMVKYAHALDKLKQKFPRYLIQIYHQEVLNLTGNSVNPCSLVGQAYDEEIIVPELVKANERAIILTTFVQKLRLCYLFHNYPDALKYGLKAEEYLDGGRATVLVPVVSFYGSLARLAILGESKKNGQRYIMKKVMVDRRKLKKWSHTAPTNFLHKFQLVEAELLRVLGRDHEAEEKLRASHSDSQRKQLYQRRSVSLRESSFVLLVKTSTLDSGNLPRGSQKLLHEVGSHCQGQTY